jgi:predicted TIM-barrel fold metal-dependent hydrolase
MYSMNTDTTSPPTDTHFHVFDAGVGVAGARYVPTYAAALSDWRAHAAAAGIARGVLVQPSFLGADNRKLLAELAAQPDTLRGVAVVAPGIGMAALAPLHAAGVRGIRLNLAGGSAGLGAWAGATTLWDAVLALGWHVELHGDVGGLPGLLPGLPAALPLVIDHMGKPDSVAPHDATFSGVARRAQVSAVHVKLSGAYRLGGRDARAIARRWLDLLGPQALLWGSDWPCTNHESEANYGYLLGQLVDWVGADVASVILRDNPAMLYWGC